MKILTIIMLLIVLPACVHQDNFVIKQHRGLSEPAQRYITAMLIKCDDFAMQNALTAAKQGYSEAEIRQAYKMAQDRCVLEEKISI